jgi:CHAT domain-containing protein/tetratricopeptide (TPR) repeat protein
MLGHNYSALEWRVIDAGEHPELVPLVIDGTINMPACTVCGLREPIALASILFFFPDLVNPLIFSPQRPLSSTELQAEVDEYIGYLRTQMGSEWRNNWLLGGLPVVPRPGLSGYLKTALQQDGLSLKHLMGIAASQHQAFEVSRELEHIEAALLSWGRALKHPDFANADLKSRFSVYYLAAEDHRQRYAALGNEEDFACSSELIGKIGELGRPEYEVYVRAMRGELLVDRHVRTNDAQTILEAIIHLELALATSTEADLRLSLLFSVARAWRYEFILTNSQISIDSAIEKIRLAIVEAPQGSVEAVRARNRLAGYLDKRHQRFGDTKDLDQALRIYEEVIQIAKHDGELASAYNGRGCVLLDRFSRSGQIEDLNLAVSDLQRGLETGSSDPRDLASSLIDLGNALRTRYEVNGDDAELIAADEAYKQSLATANAHGLDPSVALRNLGILARIRYSLGGRISELGEAIAYLESAVEGTPEGSQHEAAAKMSLGSAWCDRYQRTGAQDDLDRALRLLESALQAPILPEPLRASVFESLGHANYHDYQRSQDPTTLNKAIDLLKEVCDSPQTSERMLPSVCAGYAAALSARHRLTHSSDDINLAVSVARRSLAHLPSAAPNKCQFLGLLAECLSQKGLSEGDHGTLTEAASLFHEATLDTARSPTVMIYAGSWARMEFSQENWKNAAEAYERALAARSSLLAAQVLRSEKESWLGADQDLTAGAAFAFAKNGDLARAAETIESGIATLLSDALRLGGRDEDRLRTAGHIELANEYAATALQWRFVARMQLAAGIQIGDANVVRGLDKARADFISVLDRVRELEGFSTFHAQASSQELKQVSNQFGGPLVYAVATQHGTLILLVQPHEIRAKWAPLTNKVLDDLLVRKEKDGTLAGLLSAQFGLGTQLEDELANILPVLEDQFVAPLRQELHLLSCKRIALILPGKLGILPVSACLLDDVCVHMQVNGRSLSSAIEEATRRVESDSVLAVGNPLPNQHPLPAAGLEAAIIATHFSQSTLMVGTAVNPARFFEVLQSASHLHLACHGHLDPVDILQSALQLGGPNELKLQDLLFGSCLPKRARMAVLSACQSAIPDIAKVPDEIIGLPAAFLEAGVPAVVGTLWPVTDYSTALLMGRFYRAYFDDHIGAPEALRAAQRWLRSVTAGELVTFFREARNKAEIDLDVPYETVSNAWRHFLAMPRDYAPFALPVYWAPFVCYGA